MSIIGKSHFRAPIIVNHDSKRGSSLRSCLIACHSVLLILQTLKCYNVFQSKQTKQCRLMMDELCKNSYESNLLAVLWTSNECCSVCKLWLNRELAPNWLVLSGHMYSVSVFRHACIKPLPDPRPLVDSTQGERNAPVAMEQKPRLQ